MPLHHGPPQFCSCKHLTESDENGALWFCILYSSHRIEETDAGQYPSHQRYLHVPGLERRSGTSWPYEESTVRYCAAYLVQQEQAEGHRVRLRDHEDAPFQLLLLLPFRSVSHLPHLPHRATPGPGASTCISPGLGASNGRRILARAGSSGSLSLVISLGSTLKSAYGVQNTAGTEYCAEYPGRPGPWSISQVLRGGQPGLPAHVCATSVMKRPSRHASLAFF